jgi:hypothetical protein
MSFGKFMSMQLLKRLKCHVRSESPADAQQDTTRKLHPAGNLFLPRGPEHELFQFLILPYPSDNQRVK